MYQSVPAMNILPPLPGFCAKLLCWGLDFCTNFFPGKQGFCTMFCTNCLNFNIHPWLVILFNQQLKAMLSDVFINDADYGPKTASSSSIFSQEIQVVIARGPDHHKIFRFGTNFDFLLFEKQS